LGYTEEEFKGLDNIEQLIHEEDRPLVHQRYTERLDGTHRHADLVEVRYRHKDGHDVWVQVSSGLLIMYQGKQATLATFVDITEHKHAIEKLEKTLREKEHLLAEVERQKNIVLRSFIQGQEDERHRIAQDLHDGVGHLLSIVKIGLSSFQENVQALAPERLDDFQHFLRIYDQAVQEVRAVSHQLMPATLRKMGLKAALQDLATMLTLSGKIRVDVSLEALDTLTTQLDNELETSVFRIVQELANNTVKYAQARTVSIQIINHSSSLLCIYEDDGIGFDVHNVPRGLGLNNIYNRVLLLGGTAEFDSALGNGMVATIEIPVHSLLFEKAI
jgi:PAS domain S-box-containing protein